MDRLRAGVPGGGPSLLKGTGTRRRSASIHSYVKLLIHLLCWSERGGGPRCPEKRHSWCRVRITFIGSVKLYIKATSFGGGGDCLSQLGLQYTQRCVGVATAAYAYMCKCSSVMRVQVGDFHYSLYTRPHVRHMRFVSVQIKIRTNFRY